MCQGQLVQTTVAGKDRKQNMKYRIPTTLIAAVFLTLSSPAMARVNPLKVIAERNLRTEIIVVMDTSGSMAWYPNPSTQVGTDCGGNREGTVDLCGDGLCSGSEGSSGNLCAKDCNISSHYKTDPGSPPMCDPGKVKRSRMFMVKRVLQTLLPEIRMSASLGLVTFKQTGYYRYYPANTTGGFKSEWVWEKQENWGWKWTKVLVKKKKKNGKWKYWYKWKKVWTFLGYKWVWVEKKIPILATTKKVTIFLTRSEMEKRGAWDESLEAPKSTFSWNGTGYTLLSAAGLTVGRDSLYVRSDKVDEENRFKFSVAGLAHVVGANTWRYSGSYYTYAQQPVDYNSPKVFPKYYGPQFTDANNKTWIYHRFNGEYESQGINGQSSGMVAEALSTSSTTAEVDEIFYRIMGRFSQAHNGGIWAWGGTPTGPAIDVARNHFVDRKVGNGPFSGVGADAASGCRKRYVLVLTDGQSNQGGSPITAVRNLFQNANFSGNEIKTLVVGLPGLPSSAISELDNMADYGDDGKKNNSKNAYYANNYGSLITVLRDAFLEMLKGDYTTTAPGVSSSDQAYVVNDTALIPSTEYPKWRGHFRAMDLTKFPSVEKWDAAKELNKVAFNKRKLYTGYPNSNGGDPVPLFDDSGKVNLTKVRAIWAVAGTPPTDSEIQKVVQWLAGKDKVWKLGPIFRSGPASVGPPPSYNVPNHHLFRSTYENRERLIYITSNDGILHAFRSKDGTEAFGFVPPNLWPQIFNLWNRGGQDSEPDRFKWLLASSPRVEDIPPAYTPGSWRTHLTIPMGPYGKHFVSLDITDPSTCTSVSCTNNDPPFLIVGHSSELNMATTLGETWSVPVYYYTYPSANSPAAELAMGSGYGTGNQGSYYNRLAKTYGDNESKLHSGSGATVDYAVLADTAAATNNSKGRRIIATYQGDLNGRIVRYDEGNPYSSTSVISGGAGNPIYHSPALTHQGNKEVVLAAVSGSDREMDPAPNTESTLYLRSETDGTVSMFNHRITCKVSDICSMGSGCPIAVPSNCTAPSSSATPVGSPLLIENNPAAGMFQLEAFYLLYDPPQDVCGVGDSYLLRMSTNKDKQEVVSITKYAGVRATGMTLAGAGLDLAIAKVGAGTEQASVFTVSNAIANQGGISTPPVIEVWREVRNNP